MGIWRRFFGGTAGTRTEGLQVDFPSYAKDAAANVTIDSALQLSAVWACTKLIAESISSLPLHIYKRDPATGIREKDTTHPLWMLLKNKPNRWQTRQEFFETISYQLVMMGNCYCAIERGSGGRIVSLVPLMSQQMQVELAQDGSIIYFYTGPRGQQIAYSDKSIWHVKLFGNGIIGLSPLGYARNSIGIAIAADSAVTTIYQDGGKPSGVLTIDKLMTPAQRAKVKENFAEIQEGNDARLFVLEAGMKYQQISLSPQDIELLASRRFQIEDIARFFGVPSVLINDTQATTAWGSGIGQLVQGFYKLGLRPYLERFEASMRAWLLEAKEFDNYEFEFDFSALLLQDFAERIKSYKEAVQGGIICPNEARVREGWEPKEGGDQLLVQRQMVALENLGEVTNAETDGNGKDRSDEPAV